jgi:hypothetical protein
MILSEPKIILELEKHKCVIISKEDYIKAEKEINKHMEDFNSKCKYDLGVAIESARKTILC